MKYMSDFIIYLYTMELIETIRMTEWKTWFHIYKIDDKYHLYVFNLVSDTPMGFCSDTIEWIHKRIDSMEKWERINQTFNSSYLEIKEKKKSEYKDWLLAILICLLLSLPCIVASILQ